MNLYFWLSKLSLNKLQQLDHSKLVDLEKIVPNKAQQDHQDVETQGQPDEEIAETAIFCEDGHRQKNSGDEIEHAGGDGVHVSKNTFF